MEVEERITRSGLISQEKKISLPSSQSHSPRFLELVGKGLGQDLARGSDGHVRRITVFNERK